MFAQGLTLDLLLQHANQQLSELAPRYRLSRVPGTDLSLQVIDLVMASEIRSVDSLSGGESFLVSLALALGLSDLAATNVHVGSLFIDEGFGTLDANTLDVALAVLDGLRERGRVVGLISHVSGLAERIGAQVRVTPQGAGRSTVDVIIS
jgi:exonuclease SbcC